DDFDQRIAQWLAVRYRELSGSEFPSDPRLRQVLRETAERTKRRLSEADASEITFPEGQFAPVGLTVELSRSQLEALTVDLLDRMAVAAKQALADAQLRPEEIERVLLVGGATRMPAVRRLATSLMGREPYRYIDPDEVVATGAAIEAGVILGHLNKVVLLDVLPLSLGVETQGGLMSVIIPRNSPLPAIGSRLFTTAVDYQTSMDIQVLQGERQLAEDNVSLGCLQLTGICSAPRGAPKVEVAFDVDVDGIIHVSASDLLSESVVEAKVSSTKLLDRQEIQRLADDARRFEAQDRAKREETQTTIEARNLIEAARVVLGQQAPSSHNGQTLDLAKALDGLKQALADGAFPELRTRCDQMKGLLSSLTTV
ncbi:MAG: Hsp70 family protein, partial [Chloroflexota bacterium]